MGHYVDNRCADAAPWDEYCEKVTRQKTSSRAVRESTFALPSPYNRPNPAILEADVLKATMATLQARGLWHRRIEGGGVIHWTAGEGVLGASRMQGMSDVLALWREGRLMSLELKKPGGRVKGSQLGELRCIQAGGGIAAILCLPDSCARLISDLEKGLELRIDPTLQVPVY